MLCCTILSRISRSMNGISIRLVAFSAPHYTRDPKVTHSGGTAEFLDYPRAQCDAALEHFTVLHFAMFESMLLARTRQPGLGVSFTETNGLIILKGSISPAGTRASPRLLPCRLQDKRTLNAGLRSFSHRLSHTAFTS